MAETPLNRLLSSGEAAEVHASDLESFLSAPLSALLITGDPAQRPEAQDIAVVGQELRRLAKGALSLGVVSPADEDAVRATLQVTVVPTVVFAKAGRVVATVPRLQDWAAYARAATMFFPKEVTK